MISRTLLRQSRTALRTSAAPAQSQFLLSRPASSSFTFASPARQSVLGSARVGAQRWYSSEPEAKKEEEKKEAAAAPSAEEALKTEMEKKDREIIDLKDKYLRSIADFRNLQERTKRDMTSARDFAIQKFAKDLIESVDNFDLALSNVPASALADTTDSENQDLKSLYDGLKMTESILLNTLKKHGLEKFDPSVEGEKFNPNEHEATFMTKMEGKEDGSVFHTQSKGFKLNGRVLRAAKVGVVKNS